MKLRFPSLVALSIALSASLLTPTFAAEEHTELGEHMEMIGKAFRTLRKDARDPANNQKCADTVAQMLSGAKASLDHKPAWTAEQPADKQAAYVEDYVKEMKVFVGLLTDLEKAFRSGDSDGAGALIEKLRDQQNLSHQQFKKPDED
jgi:soluble cytochrome b562